MNASRSLWKSRFSPVWAFIESLSTTHLHAQLERSRLDELAANAAFGWCYSKYSELGRFFSRFLCFSREKQLERYLLINDSKRTADTIDNVFFWQMNAGNNQPTTIAANAHAQDLDFTKKYLATKRKKYRKKTWETFYSSSSLCIFRFLILLFLSNAIYSFINPSY